MSGSSWRGLLLRIGEKCPEYGGNTDFKEHIEFCHSGLWRELEHSRDDILDDALDLDNCDRIWILMRFLTVLWPLIIVETQYGSLDHKSQLAVFKGALPGNNLSIRVHKVDFLTQTRSILRCAVKFFNQGLVVLFETLSSAATSVDEEKGNPSWQPRADFYVTCILSCLPWGGAELNEQVPEEIERVMVAIEAYLSIRKHSSDVGFSVFEEDDDETGKTDSEKDFLEDLWDRIQDLSRNGWKLDSVPRPHLSFEARLVAGKSHDIGPISCPQQPHLPSTLSEITLGKEKHEAESKYPQRIHRLNIFPANKIEDLQPIDRRKECASYMVGLPVPFRYEYLMAETIFSQLLLLPHPPFKPMYYTLVIIDLCKAVPGAFPAVVVGAVRALFERIADLDMECRTRLILWFSHHLSNFQFIWPWEEWAYVLDLPKWAPQRVFVQEVLEREVCLSYWDKVKQSVENAPALEELLPPKRGLDFKYSTEDGREITGQYSLSEELRGMVKGRLSAREVFSWMEENVLPSHGFEVALKIVVQTLLDIGSKSFTHLITVLERYGQVFAKLCPDQDRQVMLITEVSSYWKNSTQLIAIAIDRMMGYRLISTLAIVRWVFSPSKIEQFHTSDHPWEILGNAVGKAYNRIRDLRKEISSLKKAVALAEEVAEKAKAELEYAESKLSLVDGEPVLGENL
ncbi:MIF4G-like, type 2 [Dillenia turbinata]|uniref:MIF4G-like, type 2 n=1 Tax=Dillenia turbinata TaxID=194707 RepID=A0AAN8Z7M4_9MAGN